MSDLRDAISAVLVYLENEDKPGAQYALVGIAELRALRDLAEKQEKTMTGELNEFQKYPELERHIRIMASTGATGSPADWNHFVYALNSALAQPPLVGDEQIGRCVDVFTEFADRNPVKISELQQAFRAALAQPQGESNGD